MKRKLIMLFIILSVGIIAFGLLLLRLKTSTPSSGDLNQDMRNIITEFTKKNESIKNCVFSVMKGDSSFFWSDATGMANQENKVLMTKSTPFYIASITKLYTATTIMILYEKGELSLDDPMSKYLRKDLIKGIHVYKGKDYSNEITIKELLSHTSGIADYYTEKPKGGKSLFEMFIEEPDRLWTVDETIKRVQNDLIPIFIPEADGSYSDTNYQLLGKVIESIANKPLQMVFQEFFFVPLGLKNTWLVGNSIQHAQSQYPADVFYKNMNITKTRSNGSYWADGGIVSTAEEMIIFLKALNEGRIISKKTVRLMHNWHSIHQFPIQYGFGTMYFKLPKIINNFMKITPIWGHFGSTGSFLFYSEELDLYMAGTINQVELKSKSFTLMQNVMKLIKEKK
jgi:D-alanyl-D-alanine carboxypeptidase